MSIFEKSRGLLFKKIISLVFERRSYTLLRPGSILKRGSTEVVVGTFFIQKTRIFKILDIFIKYVKNFKYVGKRPFFSVPLRKESHFFSFSLLCRRFETSQRCLTLFCQKSAFSYFFWIFLKIEFFVSLNSRTTDALTSFGIFGKYFFSHVKKDNLALIIFGHFKNVHF
jgi:hypothetical protein